MRAEIVVKVANNHQYTNSRTRKEALCVLISSACRSGDENNLADLIDSQIEAKKAINLYREQTRKGDIA